MQGRQGEKPTEKGDPVLGFDLTAPYKPNAIGSTEFGIRNLAAAPQRPF